MRLILFPFILLYIVVTHCPIEAGQAVDAEIIKLVKTIDDNPDPLHSDYTPSVHQLIQKGLPAASHVLMLMASESTETRMRAQRVLEGVTMKQYGFVEGKGWSQADGEQKWRGFWKKLGNMQWSESVENRSKSIVLWKQWLEDNEMGSGRRHWPQLSFIGPNWTRLAAVGRHWQASHR